VEDELAEIEGVTSAMMVALGENGIKTVEDLADCATDELAGWQERAHGQTKQHPGILQAFNLPRSEVERLILNARIKAGWIEAPAPVEEAEASDEGVADEAEALLAASHAEEHAHGKEKA
jgi:N utilization substance protein A